MTGFIPLTNCRCLALLTRSSMRKSTKLAGTKDMAKITQMETSTSTEVAILPRSSGLSGRRGAPRDPRPGTHRAASESCSLVRLRGWLVAVMP